MRKTKLDTRIAELEHRLARAEHHGMVTHTVLGMVLLGSISIPSNNDDMLRALNTAVQVVRDYEDDRKKAPK